MAQGSDRRAGWLDVIAGGGHAPGAGAETTAEALRAAIAETREQLARHLGALKPHLFHPHLSTLELDTQTDTATTKTKAATRSSSGGGPSKARASTKPSSSSAKGRTPADSRTAGPAPKASSQGKPAASPTKA